MNTLNVPLPDDLKLQLEAFCRQQQVPLSEVVRDSLRQYLAVEQFRASRVKIRSLIGREDRNCRSALLSV